MKTTKEMNKKTTKCGKNHTSHISPHTSQNGITLIALVITIIVMLILVSVTISMAVNGGLFDYAGKATGDTKNAIGAEQELSKGGLKVGNTYYDSIDDYLNGIESVKSLQEKHEFTYYSSLGKAVTDVNNNTRENADAEKEEAVAGVYTDEKGGISVVLLKDSIEATRVQPSVDMTINLGGHTLSSDNVACIGPMGGNLIIDGRLAGSSIEVNKDATCAGISLLQSSLAESVTLKGVHIFVNCTSGNAYGINNSSINSNLVVLECKFIVEALNGSSQAVFTKSVGTISDCNIKVTATNDNVAGINNIGEVLVENCIIEAISTNANSVGIINDGTATISECNVFAYSNLTSEVSAYGVQNIGTLNINNCYVRGIKTGLYNNGTLYVEGGTYEGYLRGGCLFVLGNMNYLRNAIIRECAMPDGYTSTIESDNTGFIIGGNSSADNIKVYMDNCDIYGSVNPFSLIGKYGEQNNALYISNSRINTDKQIDIGNNTHKLYIGKGCNFTAENTNLPSAVVKTEEVYVGN